MNQQSKEAQTPVCVGIIMDGNRRWAKGNKLEVLKGHEAGKNTLIDTCRFAKEAGIHSLVFYTFSTENWRRSEDEVSGLMSLLEHMLENELHAFKQEGACVRFIGERERFSQKIQELMHQWEKETTGGTITVALALSYGGRADILQAANKLKEHTGEITEENFSQTLWTHDLPNPDMIIRTGGEKRLSGFLTWNSVYSELFFTDTLWPDFSKEEFSAMLEEYATRQRRHGR